MSRPLLFGHSETTVTCRFRITQSDHRNIVKGRRKVKYEGSASQESRLASRSGMGKGREAFTDTANSLRGSPPHDKEYSLP